MSTPTTRNARTGKLEWKTPQELADRVLAFPNELAVRDGKLRPVHRSLVDYELPGRNYPRWARGGWRYGPSMI
jgi:hypothetical protein